MSREPESKQTKVARPRRVIITDHDEWCAFCGATAYGGVCAADSSHDARRRRTSR